MCDIPFDRLILQLSNGIRHVMPLYRQNARINSKGIDGSAVSQPAVCSNGLNDGQSQKKGDCVSEP
jgi:hypothetical protein